MIESEPDWSVASGEPSIRELVSTASEQLSALVRLELRSAQAELAQKAKSAGVGAGLFGGAAMLGFLALEALVVAAVAALALVLPAWGGALIVAFGLAVLAGIVALAGRRKTRGASPLAPEATIRSVHADAEEIVEKVHKR